MKPTIPILITLLYLLIMFFSYIVFKPKGYDMNGYIPSTNIVHSEIVNGN